MPIDWRSAVILADADEPTPRLELNAVGQADLDNGRPDYHVEVNGCPVGRIYLTNHPTPDPLWFWGVCSVWSSVESGIIMHGYAATLGEARANFRETFDLWLAWILAIPPEHLSHDTIDREAKALVRANVGST